MIHRFLTLVNASPGTAALIDGATGAVTTREALLARANELASQLAHAGLRPRDAMAIQLPSSARSRRSSAIT